MCIGSSVQPLKPLCIAKMSKEFKKYRKDLHFLGVCTPKTRKSILKNAETPLIKAIQEVVHTVLSNEIPITSAQKKRLIKNKAVLKQLADKSKNITQKRKILGSQKGSGILGFLFNVVKKLLIPD